MSRCMLSGRLPRLCSSDSRCAWPLSNGALEGATRGGGDDRGTGDADAVGAAAADDEEAAGGDADG